METLRWVILTTEDISDFKKARIITRCYELRWRIESAPQAHKVEIKGIISKCSKAVGKMMVGPSKSAVRSGFQVNSGLKCEFLLKIRLKKWQV